MEKFAWLIGPVDTAFIYLQIDHQEKSLEELFQLQSKIHRNLWLH